MTIQSKITDILSNPIDNDPLIRQAINEIKSVYGDVVSVDAKAKSLLKFGRNEAVGTAATGYTIMTLPSGVAHETYVSTNTIAYVSSSNAGDTVSIVYEGHTISGGELTFFSDTVTLQGQTKVALPTAGARVNRAYNTNGAALVGNIYFYEDDTVTAGVPNTATKVHLMIPAGKQQSYKTATSISKTDYWIVTGTRASVLEKTAASAAVTIQYRQIGGIFRPCETFGASSPGAPSSVDCIPYKIVPKNSDVRMIADSSAAGTDISGSISGFLATIIG